MKHFSVQDRFRAVPTFFFCFPSFALIMDTSIRILEEPPSHNGFVFIFTLHSRCRKNVSEWGPPKKEISVRIRREIMTDTYKLQRTPINSINEASKRNSNIISSTGGRRWKWNCGCSFDGAPGGSSSCKPTPWGRQTIIRLLCYALFIAIICLFFLLHFPAKP